MIDREHQSLSVSRQCRLLGVSRSTLYYRPLGESAATLELMRRIDELYLQYPFYGSRQMVRHLAREGVAVGRHRVRRLMRLLGLEAIYRKPRTSVANPEHRVYPYLLRGLTIERPNQVWCADITYIPVQGGFLYLVAIMDWASRRWRGGCPTRWTPSSAWRRWRRRWKATASGDLQHRSGQPVHQYRVHWIAGDRGRCSMDGPVGVWTTCSSNGCGALKYEAVYLHDLEDGFVAQRVIAQWIGFYNEQRPHSALAGRTPAEAYRDGVAERRRRWRSEQERQATGMGCEGARERERGKLSTYTQARPPPRTPPPFTAA